MACYGDYPYSKRLYTFNFWRTNTKKGQMSQTLNLRLGIFAQKEEYNMQDLKNIIKLLGMAAYVIAAIGGFAYMGIYAEIHNCCGYLSTCHHGLAYIS